MLYKTFTRFPNSWEN